LLSDLDVVRTYLAAQLLGSQGVLSQLEGSTVSQIGVKAYEAICRFIVTFIDFDLEAKVAQLSGSAFRVNLVPAE
jgi:hypothetical protein